MAKKKALEKMKAELHEGNQEIAAQQKRIKAADRLEFSWAVIKA